MSSPDRKIKSHRAQPLLREFSGSSALDLRPAVLPGSFGPERKRVGYRRETPLNPQEVERFSVMYAEHEPRLERYFVPRVGGRVQLAQDLSGEVFVRAMDQWETYDERGLPVGAWLFRIAHNLLVDHMRRLPKQPMAGLEEVEQTVDRKFRALEDTENRVELEKVFKGLTKEQQEVINLRFLEGLTIAETAAAMGKTEEAIKKLQARGLMSMRKRLKEPIQKPASEPVEKVDKEAQLKQEIKETIHMIASFINGPKQDSDQEKRFRLVVEE